MTIKEYAELARRTQNKALSMQEKRLHALHGMASEVGEIHAIYQKAYQGHPVDIDRVVDEIGDLMWFASELCDAIGVQLEEVAGANIEKLRRRYPGDGFDAERSVHRERYE